MVNIKTNIYDQLIDWKEFELFIQKMYQEDPNLKVEHNVTLIGKSGAKRQIDVLITQENTFHKYTTLVECKRWKDKVTRAVIDVLYASIEDLNASKGVIFTTTGYEEGAEKYASSKNIDIFVIRELTDEEWGLPGRLIHFYVHLYASKFTDISFRNATLIPLVNHYSENLNLNIVITKEGNQDEGLFLYSIEDGTKGKHLIDILSEKQNEIVHEISKSISTPLDNGEKDASLIIESEVELDFNNSEYKQLRLPQGGVNINKVTTKLITYLNQMVFHYDRSENLNLALVVENYIAKQKHIISQIKDENNLIISGNIAGKIVKENIAKGDVLENESIMKVYTEPWVNIAVTGKETMAKTDKISIVM